MNSITYPLFIAYTDKEVSFFKDSHDFFETSGCEEYDFLDDVVRYFDLTGQLVGFDQKRKSLELTGNEISANEVEKLFAEHFAEWSPKKLSRFELRASNQAAKAIIGWTLEML